MPGRGFSVLPSASSAVPGCSPRGAHVKGDVAYVSSRAAHLGSLLTCGVRSLSALKRESPQVLVDPGDCTTRFPADRVSTKA